jgi:DNA-binding NarL/FixJ family response regulator
MDQRAKALSVFVVEEQEIYREAYKAVLTSNPSINVLKVSGNGNMESLAYEVFAFTPDVVVFSIKKCDANVIECLRQVRSRCPRIGIVLLLTFCNIQDAELLRKFISKSEGGLALFLKHSLNKVEHLCSAIKAAREGHILLDPLLTNVLFWQKSDCSPLKELTVREWEILKLLSQGYTNQAIAQALYIDSRTVGHHLNNIYAKLKSSTSFDDRHVRVNAARLFLETVGYSVTC